MYTVMTVSVRGIVDTVEETKDNRQLDYLSDRHVGASA
jgi:hypothetical protein